MTANNSNPQPQTTALHTSPVVIVRNAELDLLFSIAKFGLSPTIATELSPNTNAIVLTKALPRQRVLKQVNSIALAKANNKPSINAASSDGAVSALAPALDVAATAQDQLIVRAVCLQSCKQRLAVSAQRRGGVVAGFVDEVRYVVAAPLVDGLVFESSLQVPGNGCGLRRRTNALRAGCPLPQRPSCILGHQRRALRGQSWRPRGRR